jgi:hypothetical protein
LLLASSHGGGGGGGSAAGPSWRTSCEIELGLRGNGPEQSLGKHGCEGRSRVPLAPDGALGHYFSSNMVDGMVTSPTRSTTNGAAPVAAARDVGESAGLKCGRKRTCRQPQAWLPCWSYRYCNRAPSAQIFQGNPRYGSPRSDNGATFSVLILLAGIIFEHVMLGGDCWCSVVSSTASSVAGLDGMVLQGLSGRLL